MPAGGLTEVVKPATLLSAAGQETVTELKAGTIVMLCLGAANRDPRKFDNPHEFDPNRKNVREHITISETTHGPIDNRRYTYEPTFLLRGLTELNIEFTPATG